jgi:hypothetical protein
LSAIDQGVFKPFCESQARPTKSQQQSPIKIALLALLANLSGVISRILVSFRSEIKDTSACKHKIVSTAASDKLLAGNSTRLRPPCFFLALGSQIVD